MFTDFKSPYKTRKKTELPGIMMERRWKYGRMNWTYTQAASSDKTAVQVLSKMLSSRAIFFCFVLRFAIAN